MSEPAHPDPGADGQLPRAPAVPEPVAREPVGREPVPREPAVPESAPREPTPVRASDAEREQVAEIVRRAVGDGRLTLVEGDERLADVYASTYRGDLEPLVRDLEPDLVSQAGAEPPRPTSTRTDATYAVAVMSGAQRTGDWDPGPSHRALAAMGGVELDLRHARLGAAGLTIDAAALMGGVTMDLRGVAAPVTVSAVAIMGGVEVVVGPDAVVDEGGVGIMGGFSDEAGAPSVPGGPTVRVSGLAFWGGVSITRKALAREAGRPEER